MSRRRTFITGIGVICAIGKDFDTFSHGLSSGMNGADKIAAFKPEGIRGIYGCEVKDYEPRTYFSPKELRRMDRGSQFVLLATRQAMASSGLDVALCDKERCGVSLGSTLGGMVNATEYYRRLKKRHKVYASLLMDHPLYTAGSRVCIEYGFLGTNMATSTACSSANVAIGYGAEMIRNDEADVVIVGGYDTMAELTVAGFNVLRNVSPDYCKPFDKKRQGLVLGEGAGILILEAENHCHARGGQPYAELLGYGMSSDAYHMTALDVTGRGPALAMTRALADSGVDKETVNYINAHGTGTSHNDAVETKAIKRVFGEHAHSIPVSSTKSMHGHTLGAAGGIEAISVVAALRGGFIPPTINYETPDPKCDLDYVPNKSRQYAINVALSNNFGFGGNNCSIVIGRI